jgi:hypothetical protein
LEGRSYRGREVVWGRGENDGSKSKTNVMVSAVVGVLAVAVVPYVVLQYLL